MMRAFLHGVAAGVAICCLAFVVFPYQSVPAPLRCGMRTLDGCAIWYSHERIVRYKQGKAGSRAEFILPEDNA